MEMQIEMTFAIDRFDFYSMQARPLLFVELMTIPPFSIQLISRRFY